MDPTIANVLEELRQAGAYMPGTLPATGFGFPSLATLPANVPMSSMVGIPAPDEQAAVIERVKAAMASPDPAERAQARPTWTGSAATCSWWVSTARLWA